MGVVVGDSSPGRKGSVRRKIFEKIPERPLKGVLPKTGPFDYTKFDLTKIDLSRFKGEE